MNENQDIDREDSAAKNKTRPFCRIIAGPNGAGKTTFALKYLPEVAHCRAFVNADLIAAGLSPLEPEQQYTGGQPLVPWRNRTTYKVPP